ncbi:protein insensitive-like isoform X2 [Spodoptera frugiperda]|uniref:Protein insensitive-like isoform X2 n=1 Tax=Spodoptera frugiperda TaxID=7108 RepID=A0A9R0D7Z7_SPOFR|nr:protein insensitive-like isoform X2 [Spodoptera frugiperda]
MHRNRRDSANGSSPIFRRRSDSQSDRENRNADDMSIGSSASDEIQTDFAEVDNECEPDTVDNCFPDEILYRRLDEPGPSSSRDGRRKYREKMRRLGPGNTMVPLRIIHTIDDSGIDYPKITRRLLQYIFTRETLATHNLSGRPSPAFPNKPAKKVLNPVVVNDIVRYVCKRCKVPPSLVRITITHKCNDEAKLHRQRRQSQRLARLRRRNRENIPPRQQ